MLGNCYCILLGQVWALQHSSCSDCDCCKHRLQLSGIRIWSVIQLVVVVVVIVVVVLVVAIVLLLLLLVVVEAAAAVVVKVVVYHWYNAVAREFYFLWQ